MLQYQRRLQNILTIIFFHADLTYSGHPLACAAGVACVNYYGEAHILDNVAKSGKVLGEILEEMKAKHPCVGDVDISVFLGN